MGAPDAAYLGDGLARCASRSGQIMKRLLLSLPPAHAAEASSDASFAKPNEKQFPDTTPALTSKFQQRGIFDHDIYEIFASSPGSLVYIGAAKCRPSSHINRLLAPLGDVSIMLRSSAGRCSRWSSLPVAFSRACLDPVFRRVVQPISNTVCDK